MRKLFYSCTFLVLFVDLVLCRQEGYCCADDEIYRRDYCSKLGSSHEEPLPLSCRKFVVLPDSVDFNLNDGGQLVIHGNLNIYQEPGTFCLANVLKNKTTQTLSRVAVLCNNEIEHLFNEQVVGYCTAVSAMFFIATALFYVFNRDFRRQQESSMIRNVCCSFAIGFGILAGMKIVPYSDMTLCAIRGFLTYFFIMAGFFWTNSIAIQFVISIRRIRNGTDVIKRKEFWFFAGYSWFTPALLTAGMASVNFMPGDHLKPGIGLNHCWFINLEQQWRYMYSGISIILSVNICLFLYATYLVWENFEFELTDKLLQTAKMFVMMGIPWTLEVINGATPPHAVWDVLEIIYTFHGVFVFLVLIVFRRKTNDVSGKYGSNLLINSEMLNFQYSNFVKGEVIKDPYRGP